MCLAELELLRTVAELQSTIVMRPLLQSALSRSPVQLLYKTSCLQPGALVALLVLLAVPLASMGSEGMHAVLFKLPSNPAPSSRH